MSDDDLITFILALCVISITLIYFRETADEKESDTAVRTSDDIVPAPPPTQKEPKEENNDVAKRHTTPWLPADMAVRDAVHQYNNEMTKTFDETGFRAIVQKQRYWLTEDAKKGQRPDRYTTITTTRGVAAETDAASP